MRTTHLVFLSFRTAYDSDVESTVSASTYSLHLLTRLYTQQFCVLPSMELRMESSPTLPTQHLTMIWALWLLMTVMLDLSLGGSMTRNCVDDNGLDAIGEFNNQAPRCICKSYLLIASFQ